MAESAAIRLNTRGLLDTAMPITDRDPGTLVTAQDVSSQYLGPRPGMVSFARCGEGPGNGFLYGYVTFDGTDGTARALNSEDAQRDLGTKWTLDWWGRLTDHTYAGASGKDFIPLAMHSANPGLITLGLIGPADATHVGKVHISILNTASIGVASAATYTQRGSVAISEGTTQDKNTHIRVVRSGSSVSIFTNGVLNSVGATTGAIVATEGIYVASSSPCVIGIGYPPTASYASAFKGRFYGACLRDGAFDAYPIETSFPANFRGRNVHWFITGRRITDGTYPHLMDISRFGTHANMGGTGFTFTASNDNDFPVPAPVQGIGSWTSRRQRRVVAAMIGGRLARKQVS